MCIISRSLPNCQLLLIPESGVPPVLFEDYKFWSYFSDIPTAICLSVLGTNMPASSLFPNTLNLCSFIRVTGHNSDSWICVRILSCITRTVQMGIVLWMVMIKFLQTTEPMQWGCICMKVPVSWSQIPNIKYVWLLKSVKGYSECMFCS